MMRYIVIAIAILWIAGIAQAQISKPGIPIPLPITGSSSGVGPTPGPVTANSVTVTNVSGTLAAANAYTLVVKVCIDAGQTNGIWVRWDGGVAAAATPAEHLLPGACAVWSRQGGYMPTTAWNAITDGGTATPVSLIGQ